LACLCIDIANDKEQIMELVKSIFFKNKYQILGSMLISILVIVFKLWYRSATISEVDFLLAPTNWVLSQVLGVKATFEATLGYFYPSYNMVVDKSCSGGNFFLLSVIIILYVQSSHTKNYVGLIKGVVLGILGGWAYVILANVSRICSIIILNNIGADHYQWTHEVIGGLIYLCMLCLLYALATTIVSRSALIRSNTQSQL